MHTPHTCGDREAALAFIAAQQASPQTACAFLGTVDEGLEVDLDELDQPWVDTIRVCTDDAGTITGAALIEWESDEVNRSWVYGPWTTPETWERDSAALLAAVVAQAPVERHDMFAPLANERMAELAKRSGWSFGDTNYIYVGEVADLPEPTRPVRRATPDDLAGVAALHDAEFPGSYATAAELLAPDGEYTTFVAEHAGEIVGYLAGHYGYQGGYDGDEAYLDFMMVRPDARRRGVATSLLAAFARGGGQPVARVTLCVDEKQTEARGLYEALGWRLTTPTRGYRYPPTPAG